MVDVRPQARPAVECDRVLPLSQNATSNRKMKNISIAPAVLILCNIGDATEGNPQYAHIVGSQPTKICSDYGIIIYESRAQYLGLL